MQNQNSLLRALTIVVLALGLSVAGCQREEEKTAQPARTLNLKVVVGEQFGAYLPALNAAFLATNPLLADGSRIVTELVFESDLTAASRIASGEIKSHGWIAPSLSLVNLVNKTRINLGPEQGECSPLFETPVVAALHERFVKQLDPGNTGRIKLRSLLDIPDLPSLAGTWSAVAISHAHPVHSLTGLAALTELLYLAAGSDLLNTSFLKDQNFRRTLAKYAMQVNGYPLSDEELLMNALSWNGPRISLALTTEQAVKAYDNSSLKLLYPEEGSFANVYHLCASRADWVTPAHGAALRVFRNYLQSQAADWTFEKAGFRRDHIKRQRDNAASPGPAPTRTFSALPGELVRELLKNWPLYRRPYATILVMDTSTGMAGDPLDLGKKYFSRILELDTPNDFAALISFDSEARVVSGFVPEPASLTGPLRNLSTANGNALHQALQKVLHLARETQVKMYLKKVVVFTDASDKASFSAIKNFLAEAQSPDRGEDFDITIVAVEQPNTEPETYGELLNIAQRPVLKLTTPLDLESVFNDLLKTF